MHALAVLAKINGFIIVLPWVCVCVCEETAGQVPAGSDNIIKI